MVRFDYQITDVLRGISVNHNVDKGTTPQNGDNTIWDLADKQSDKETNKTAITVLLEDFAEVTNGFHDNNSCIEAEDAGKYGFIGKLFAGKRKNNVFKTDEAKTSLTNNGVYKQKDIYQQEVAKNGGVKYADDKDDIYQAALNFAKADIKAIEQAYFIADEDHDGPNGKLTSGEVSTYDNEVEYGSLKDIISEMSLDKKTKNITAEEYASYMIAIDGLVSTGSKTGFSSNSVDGLVSTEQVQLASQMDTKELQAIAAQIYKSHFQ